MKHLWLASLRHMAQHYEEMDEGKGKGGVRCYCLPETSLMMMGCKHKRDGLLMYCCTSLQMHFSNAMCVDCSTCMRCSG